MPKRFLDVLPLTVEEERLKAHTATRSGKWTIQEEQYAEVLVDYFRNGWLADCFDGTTLRVYLTIKLGCSPMRVSKKFSGKPLGLTYRKVSVSEERLVILATLRKRFTDSVALYSGLPMNSAPYTSSTKKSEGDSSGIAPSSRSQRPDSGSESTCIKKELDSDFPRKHSRYDCAVQKAFLAFDEDHESGRASFCSATTDCEEDCSWCAATQAEEAGPSKEASSSFSPGGMAWDCLRSLDPLLLQSSPMMQDRDFLALMDDIADSVEIYGKSDRFALDLCSAANMA